MLFTLHSVAQDAFISANLKCTLRLIAAGCYLSGLLSVDASLLVASSAAWLVCTTQGCAASFNSWICALQAQSPT